MTFTNNFDLVIEFQKYYFDSIHESSPVNNFPEEELYWVKWIVNLL